MSEYDEIEDELSLEDESGDDLFEHHKIIADKGQGPIRIDVFLQTNTMNYYSYSS